MTINFDCTALEEFYDSDATYNFPTKEELLSEIL